MDLYKWLLRPLLFRLPAETAHRLGRLALRPSLAWQALAPGLHVHDPRLYVHAAGLSLANPVGLAAGFDKDCELADSLLNLGFGYVVLGTVMPRRVPGNPRPRLLRSPDEQALLNCLGLPSQGLDYALNKLRRRRSHRAPVVVSIGAFAPEDYLHMLAAVEPVADAVEVNFSCPNVQDRLSRLLAGGQTRRLLTDLTERKQRPVLVKFPAHLPATERLRLVDLALELGVDGFTISGSFSRPDLRLSTGRGSVTGAPTRERALQAVRELYAATGGRAWIKALGGMATGADAFAAIAAGATTVELLTAMVYQGWTVASRVNRELLILLDRYGIRNLAELRGSERNTVRLGTGRTET